MRMPCEATYRAAAPDHSRDRPAVKDRTRVLFIDDDENLLDIIREVLEANGFEVQTARHGFLAGYLVAHFQPSVIVLDIMMPGLDGFEVMSLLRKRPEAREVPVIACTSMPADRPCVMSNMLVTIWNSAIDSRLKRGCPKPEPATSPSPTSAPEHRSSRSACSR